MKTCLRFFLAAGIALLLGANLSFAQSRHFAFSIQGGGAGHEENNLNVGLASGIGLAYPLTSRLSVTAEVDYWGTKSRSSYRKLYNGRLALMPVLLGLRYEFGGNGYFVPYVVGGIGYIGSRFRMAPLVTVPEVTIDQKVSSGWAGYAGFGAMWRLSSFWDFFSEMNYIIRTAPGQTIVHDLHAGDATDYIWINLHVVYWKFGLRFIF